MAYYAKTIRNPNPVRTRNVVLTDHQAELIDNLVEEGRYQNASEALREGIRLLEVREAQSKARIEAMRAAIVVGDVDIEAGRSKVFKGAGLRRHLKSLTRSAMAKAARTRRRK